MILWCLFRRLGIESININNKTNKTTYGGKSHGCASRPCPPLWHAQFTSHATHWSTLIRNPINCLVSIRLPFTISSCHRTGSESVVIHIFNPWYCRVMDIGFVAGIYPYDLQLSALQWVCQDKTQKAWNELLHNENNPEMEYGPCEGDHAEKEILKRSRKD